MKKIDKQTWMHRGYRIELTNITTEVRYGYRARPQYRYVYEIYDPQGRLCMPMSRLLTTLSDCRDAINARFVVYDADPDIAPFYEDWVMGAIKQLLIEAEEEEREILTYLNDLLYEHGWEAVPHKNNNKPEGTG